MQISTGYSDIYKQEIFTIYPYAEKHKIFRYVQARDIYKISFCRKAQDIQISTSTRYLQNILFRKAQDIQIRTSTKYLQNILLQKSTGYSDKYKHEIFTKYPFAEKHRILTWVSNRSKGLSVFLIFVCYLLDLWNKIHSDQNIHYSVFPGPCLSESTLGTFL